MKKKFLSFILALCLIVPCLFSLTACEKHEHNWEAKYSVNDGKAYVEYSCDGCNKEKPKTELTDYVIVTPETVQAELDKNIDGKTIVFDAGNYENRIYIRPSYDTTTTYAFISTTERGTTVISNEDVKDGDVKTQYHYFRALQNVKFVGVEGVTISKELIFYTGPLGFVAAYHDVLAYDAVKQIDFSTNSQSAYASYSHINLKNITIENLNFSTNTGNISVYYNSFENSTENFTVKNCNFENTTDTKTKCALQITARDNVGIIKNVTFENNYVDGYFKALEAVAFENATVRGNTIKNCKHNAISLFGGDVSGKEQYMKGTLIVENNTITNGTDRAIKFDFGENCNILVKNNVINDYHDDSDNVIRFNKFSISSASTLTFVNNTYNGKKYNNINNENINDLGTINSNLVTFDLFTTEFVN